jgi:hypothetical protein
VAEPEPISARHVVMDVRIASLTLLLVAASLLSAACAAPQAVEALSPSPPVPATASADPYGWIDAAAARRVTTVVKLVDAYNAADLAGVQALLAPEVAWADCAGDKFLTISGEFGTPRPMTKAETIPYFQARFADRDRMEIAQITTAPCNGGDCVGIRFGRRSNDSLRAIGFPDGFVGPQTNKTVFDASGLVVAFANASGPQDCHPK